MAVRSTITVSVTPDQQAFPGGRVRTGRYGGVREVVRAAQHLRARSEPDFPRKAPARLDHADRKAH